MPPKKRKPAAGKPDAGKPNKPANTAPKTPAQPGLAKTKGANPQQQKPKVLTPQQRVAKLRTDADVLMKSVFGASVERDDDGDGLITNSVIDEIAFDRDEVRRLAVALAEEVEDIRDSLQNNPVKLAAEEVRIQGLMANLRDQLATSRRPVARLAGIKQYAAGFRGGIVVETDPLTADLWGLASGEIVKPRPVALLDNHMPDSRLVNVDLFVDAIKGRLLDVDSIITTLNGRPGVPQVNKIPNDLFAAMGRENPGTTALLRALRSGLALEPDPTALKTLLAAADVPTEVPKLLSAATAVGAVLLDVLTACRATAPPGQPAPHGPAALKGNTELAGKLLKTIADSGQDADFFLTGAGGQSLANLRYATVSGDPVWGGATVATSAVRFGPVGHPVLFAQITAIAEPLPPLDQHTLPPLPPGVVRDRYVGGMQFNNSGGAMILPVVDNTTNAQIHYREYDIRPFTFTYERGGERVVVGSDGNQYYTDDHYKTFRRIA
ncbi:ribonuclease domain-containing protein [Saccharothrix sp. HUAS TT1]|uniref:ribonuclease domain-containing protein n=1 Tax=unclassified Saccharothrix TaxID=2593673 RepID=UPI00345C3809